MNFPIVSTKELAKIANNKIKTSPVNEREFTFRNLEQGVQDFDISDLIDLLNSPSEKEMLKGILKFSNSFNSILGVGNQIDFRRIFVAQYLAIFAKEAMGGNLTLLDTGYSTEEPMEDGTLFTWCDEVMFIYKGDTYTVKGDFFYNSFTFFEGEPAYVIGHVDQDAVQTLISNDTY